MGDPLDPVRSGRHAELFRRVWPKGISARDDAFLRSLSPDRLDILARRLDAVWRASNGERPFTALAEKAGVSRPRFYLLRKAWANAKLEELLPHSESPKRDVTSGSQAMLERAMDIVRKSDKGLRNKDIAVEALELRSRAPELQLNISELQKAERIVLRARSEVQLEERFLVGHYGKALLIDLVQTNLVLSEIMEPAVVGLVFEFASGILLGADIGPVSKGADVQAIALLNATSFLFRQGIDVRSEALAKPDLVAILAPGIHPLDVHDALRGYIKQGAFYEVGGFHRDVSATQLVGRRLGDLHLFPRHTLNTDPNLILAGRFGRKCTTEQALALLSYEMSRHNSDRLEAVRSVKFPQPFLTKKGNLAEVCARMGDHLSEVAADLTGADEIAV